MPGGIIVKGIGGFYYVKSDRNIYECKARGIFRKEEIVPLPGDKVIISITNNQKMTGNMEKILKRDSILIRPAVANVDQMVIVIAVKGPDVDYNLLDKLLIAADYREIEPVICINKIDLDEDNFYGRVAGIYENIGYKVVSASMNGDKRYEELKSFLKAKTTVFAGQSGAGKSTILNSIKEEYIMKTGEVSEKISRGKHTTRHAELIEFGEGGYIVDTPGFSSFLLEDMESDQLELYYPDFEIYRGLCKFKWCTHIAEEGCKIMDAVKDGEINKERYERYINFHTELKEREKNIWKKNKKKRNH